MKQPSAAYLRLLFPVIAGSGAVGLSIGRIIPLTSIVLDDSLWLLALLPVFGLHSGFETAYTLVLVSFFAVGSFACQPIIGWIADKILFKTIAIFVAAVSSFVVLFLPFDLHIPILTRSLIFVRGGSVGGYYTLGRLKLGQGVKGSDLTAASSMFVMAYTGGMFVGPLFCSTSMQVAGPAGLLVLPAIVPAFFILLVLKREGAAMPGGNRI